LLKQENVNQNNLATDWRAEICIDRIYSIKLIYKVLTIAAIEGKSKWQSKTSKGKQ